MCGEYVTDEWDHSSHSVVRQVESEPSLLAEVIFVLCGGQQIPHTHTHATTFYVPPSPAQAPGWARRAPPIPALARPARPARRVLFPSRAPPHTTSLHHSQACRLGGCSFLESTSQPCMSACTAPRSCAGAVTRLCASHTRPSARHLRPLMRNCGGGTLLLRP